MIYLELILYPIILVMSWILELGHFIFSSYGAAIIFLSLVVSTLTYPLSLYAKKIEHKEALLQQKMAPGIRQAKADYKGERQFLEIEKIYKEHGYHPIQSLRSLGGIALQLPFLLSAMLLLWGYPAFSETSFLVLPDLSQPDGLVSLPAGFGVDRINLLPFVMTSFSLTESFLHRDMNAAARVKVWIISIVLLALVYALPSSVLLYWTFNNLFSLSRACWRWRRS